VTEKRVFRGRLLTLVTRSVRLPNGYRARLEVIVHPGAALVVPFLTAEKIIILRQLRPVVGRYLYELPAGTLDRGETALACAKREIVEETGYAAERFVRLGEIYPVPGYSTERIVIYRAERLRKSVRVAEDDEIIESRVVGKQDVRRLFKKGGIVDAKTIAALALCGWL